MDRRWQVLLATSAAVFMVFIDTSVVNVAFPSLERAFPTVTGSGLSWVLNAYSIVFAALLVTAGRLADLWGRRRLFFAGLGIFVAASLLCALAPSVPFLVAGRALQAVGGALLTPTSLALLLRAFPAQQRATAVGIWGATGAIAAACGPSLGAILIQWQDWRWVFLINLPVGVAAWLYGRRILAESRADDAQHFPDLLGVLLAVGSVGALTAAIVQGPQWGWHDTRVTALFVTAALLFPLLLLRSARHPSPVVDLSLFRARSYALANVASLFFALAFFALLLGNVLFLTSVWHYSILRAGLAITPGPLTAAVFAAPAGQLADRFGHRVALVPGALIYSAAALLFRLNVTAHPSYFLHWLPAAILLGMGVGLTFPTLSSAAAASLPPARFAVGSAINATSRQVGTVLGVAILIAILGTPTAATALTDFDHAWLFGALAAGVSALASLGISRPRPQSLAVEEAA